MRNSPLASAFIAGRHRRLFRALLLAGILGALLAIGYGFVIWQISNHISRDRHAELERINAIRRGAVEALQTLKRDATAAPCSRDFLAQMQRVAYLPDGLNEFLYAPAGAVECSTSQPHFVTPVPLGKPDIIGTDDTDPSLRIDRDLGPLGRPGTVGTIAALGAFAVAIPPYTRYEDENPWLQKELVALGRQGKIWDIAGDRGLYADIVGAPRVSLLSQPATVATIACDQEGLYCVASKANLFAWARDWYPILMSIGVLAALFAWVCANNIIDWLNRYWSFEARFNRYLSAQSIVLAYQPIVDLRTDAIVGCEVLARWRDVDGTIVSPSRFIDIVARDGRTRDFTQMVADRAWSELSRHVPDDQSMEINFNVFAGDLDSTLLRSMFAKFLSGDPRFKLAIEIIENHDVDFEDAQFTIRELAASGINTYIDDFGTGYSSIERVATLAVHGVKLDRSFAMAPPDSILGRMLVQVVEMIKTSGRLIIVEGVETHARLQLLRATGMVDCIQGYVVSRPIGIEELAVLLGRGRSAWAARDAAA